MNSFTLSETFAHSKEKVFTAFATAHALAQWIAPMEEIVAKVEAFQFAPEGRFRIVFNVGAQDHPLEGQFLRIDAYDAMSFSWVWRPPSPHADVESHVAVSLEDTDSGTKLTLTHSRLDAPGMCERHYTGWHGSFIRLANFLKDVPQ